MNDTLTMPDMIDEFDTRVLLAVCRVHARDGRATLQSVATEANRSLATVCRRLRTLRSIGLVDYPTDTNGNGVAGSLRPLIMPVGWREHR